MDVVVIGWTPGALEAAARERAVAGLRAAGHHVTELDLHAEGFRAAMTTEERLAYHEPEPVVGEQIARHVAAVRAAEQLVFVYPTLATSVPPPVRGWLERVLLPGVAFVFDERTGRVKPGLTRVRRIVGIATYPEPWWKVKLQHDNGRRVLLRALRLNTGLRTSTAWVARYDTARGDDTDGARRNEAFLGRISEVTGKR